MMKKEGVKSVHLGGGSYTRVSRRLHTSNSKAGAAQRFISDVKSIFAVFAAAAA